MFKEPDSAVSPSLGTQITRLSQLADEVNSALQNSRAYYGLPAGINENLSQLAGSLTRISRQIIRLEEDRQNLLALTEIGQVINSSLETNDVLRIVMDTIVRLTGAERGFLMLKDDDEEMTIQVARNWEQETLDPSEFAISKTVINRVASEGFAVLTTNAQEDPRFDGQESIVAFNLRSILCVPLKYKGVITGVIYADNRVRTGLFTETERDLLTAFGNQAAVAIENAKLFESVNRTLAEVTELKNLMDNIFASIASGVITADNDDRVTLCNQAAESILGYSAEEMIGNCIEGIVPMLTEDLLPFIQAVHSHDQSFIGLDVSPELPTRGNVDLRLNLSPLKNADEETQGVAIVLEDLTEQKRLEAQRRLFEKMVSPAVIDQLDPDKVALGGKRMEITCLFADIRGFTGFSEHIPPEALVSVLNRYLSVSADAVLAQEGTIDKFMGDAIMAWFNAPIAQPDHTLRAVKAALGIRDAIRGLHEKLPQAAHLSFGVGIHYGSAVLGLVGTERRLDYTAIGDSVNTAKRIQENAGGGQILISNTALDYVRDHVEVNAVEPIMAKGKSLPLQVFELCGLRNQQ
ncbi:MAG: GAF domain-containing protein [Anaerolineales bacterium]|nr:GAF domain-containing protein [Anaerolineales bacterium]